MLQNPSRLLPPPFARRFRSLSSFRIRRSSCVLTRGRRRLSRAGQESSRWACVYCGNCFVLSHTLAESNTTQIYIFTGRLRRARTHATFALAQNRTFAPVSLSLEKYILHELSNLSLRVSAVCVSCHVVSYKTRNVHRQTTQKSERRLKDVRGNFTTSFKRLRCPEGVCMCMCVCVYALVY